MRPRFRGWFVFSARIAGENAERLSHFLRPGATPPERFFIFLFWLRVLLCSLVCSPALVLFSLVPLSNTPRKRGEAIDVLRSAVPILDMAIAALAIPKGPSSDATEADYNATVATLEKTLGGVLLSLGDSLLILAEESTTSRVAEPTDAAESGGEGSRRGQHVGSSGSETRGSARGDTGGKTSSIDLDDGTAAASTVADERNMEAARVLERASRIYATERTSAAVVGIMGIDRSDESISAERVKVRKRVACISHIPCDCDDEVHTHCSTRACHSFRLAR